MALTTTPLMLAPLHMGSLHPLETAGVIALAFGPFLALGVVLLLRRRRANSPNVDAGHEPGSEEGAAADAAPAKHT